MIPDINSFAEFLMYYAGPGFASGRWAAGNVHEHAEREAAEWDERNSKGQIGYEDYRPLVKVRTFWGFVAGFVFWPAIWGAIGGGKALAATPKGVWGALKYVFVKPPPRRIRKQKKLAQLQQRTADLEKELELDA